WVKCSLFAAEEREHLRRVPGDKRVWVGSKVVDQSTCRKFCDPQPIRLSRPDCSPEIHLRRVEDTPHTQALGRTRLQPSRVVPEDGLETDAVVGIPADTTILSVHRVRARRRLHAKPIED